MSGWSLFLFLLNLLIAILQASVPGHPWYNQALALFSAVVAGALLHGLIVEFVQEVSQDAPQSR